MQVTQIVNSVFYSNTYILSHPNSSAKWLIDIGDIDPILKYLSVDQEIKGVFITHTHYDHIYGIRDITNRFPNCLVYTSRNGRKGFFSDQYNFSRYHNDPIQFNTPNIKTVSEGDKINLVENFFLEVFETPGHDWSSLVYRLAEVALFTGDSYMPGFKVVTSFPKSNKTKAKESKEKILSMCSSKISIYPGHGKIYQY